MTPQRTLAGLKSERPAVLVIDMVEEGAGSGCAGSVDCLFASARQSRRPVRYF